MKIFEFPLRPSYYLRHPLQFYKTLTRNLKNASMRIKFGYCNDDVWNMDSWFLDIIPPMLRTMADKGCAYPGDDPFNTPEKWHDWLYDIADKLESCKEASRDKRNEYYEYYMNAFFSNKNITITYNYPTLTKDEICSKYITRSNELFKESKETIKYCFEQLGKYFFKLWD